MRPRRPGTATLLVVIIVASVLLPSGCATSEPEAKGVKVLGTDANTGTSFAAEFRNTPGAIAGMRGTTPLTELSEDFAGRLRQQNSELTELAYVGEAYDATVITALAAQIAESGDAAAFAPQINAVTVGGEKCRQVQQCLDLVAGGTDIDYDGASGGLDFTSAGEPSVGNYGLMSYDGRGRAADTTYLVTGDPKNAVTDPPPPVDSGSGQPLRLAALLPQSGALSAYGPAMLAAVRLAVRDVNAAGGVNGAPVTLLGAVDGTDAGVARQAVTRLLNAGVEAIIGPGASGVAKAVIDEVTAAGVVMFSPANTSDEFTNYDDRDLYFRTAPPDALQARLLANIIVQEGGRVVGLLHQNTPYGTGLATGIERNLIAAGGDDADIVTVGYDPADRDYRQQISQLVDLRPDFIVVAGYDESVELVRKLNAAGIGPQR